MALGESAPGVPHPHSAWLIGKHCVDLSYQIIGVADCQRRAASDRLPRGLGKISR